MRLICTRLRVLATHTCSQPHHTSTTLPHSHSTNNPPTPITTRQTEAGYTSLPLPTISPSNLCVLSHNINSLPTSSTAELGRHNVRPISPPLPIHHRSTRNEQELELLQRYCYWPNEASLCQTSMAWIENCNGPLQ
jgi:hypothetical protein